MDSIGFLVSPSFLLTTLFGFFLYYCFCRICALTTFYTIEAWGIEYFRINLVRFFAGGFIPISAFPAALKDFSNYLPFQYMIYQPARAAAGDFPEDQLGFVLLVQFAWICILLAIDQLIWKTVVRKIIVHGG